MAREEKDASRDLPVRISLADGRSATVRLTPGGQGRNCVFEKGQLHFCVAGDAHTYLSSKRSHNFGLPPEENLFLLAPDREYTLQAAVSVEGGQAELWLIEYDAQRRLCHQKHLLTTGILELNWRTHCWHRLCCLAIRLSGTGRLRISYIAIRERIAAQLRDRTGEDALPDPRADERICVLTSITNDRVLHGLRVEDLRSQLDHGDIERVVVMPEAQTRLFDAFDQICTQARDYPKRVYPLCRLRLSGALNEQQRLFMIHQLEVLWQQGLIYGVNIQMPTGTVAPAGVLDWLQRRRVLTFWHVTSEAERAWLSRDVLPHFAFPAFLYSGGGVEWRLEIPESSHRPGFSDDLWSLVERVVEFRCELMHQRCDLLFPPLPSTQEQLSAGGFEVIAPDVLPQGERQHAKEVWRQWKVVSWYQQDKPWAYLLADLVHDLRPRSVLEFGCNVGRNLVAIGKVNHDVRLVGIDVNPEAIRAGREASGLDLRCGDETALQDEDQGAYDLVFTVSVLDHIPDVSRACEALIRCAGRYLFCVEVTLPTEGRVAYHYDHRRQRVCSSTEASYSWDLAKHLAHHPRVRRLDQRPCYLHSAALGPYYRSYLACLYPVS